MFDRVKQYNTGPVKNDSLCAIYREVMSAALSLQKTLTVAYLKNHGVKDLDNAIAWLQSKGGYCDCEVLANVEE